jgi:hypothetical protein
MIKNYKLELKKLEKVKKVLHYFMKKKETQYLQEDQKYFFGKQW